MALSFEKFQSFLREAEIRYLLVPDQPIAALGSSTDSGRQFFIHASIEAEGTLMQLRTNGYLACPLSSPHVPVVMRLLNDINFRLRLVKFTMDPTDGEITVYGDLVILDSEPTATQIVVMISFFMERLRECAPRIEKTIQTGIDPDADDVIV
jgi:hypothetical protein